MESFQKLKRSYFPNHYDILNSRIKFGKIIGDEFKGIEYFDISIADTKDLYKIIPAQYREDFCATLMKINTEVPPHTDTGIKVTINLYYNTNDCVTTFYKFKDVARKYQIDNQTNGYIYLEDDLQQTGSFRAKNYESWILDVSQPHSVKGGGDRVALSLATNTYNYEQVCNMLIETGTL
jgi:hypothetical protein